MDIYSRTFNAQIILLMDMNSITTHYQKRFDKFQVSSTFLPQISTFTIPHYLLAKSSSHIFLDRSQKGPLMHILKLSKTSFTFAASTRQRGLKAYIFHQCHTSTINIFICPIKMNKPKS